MGHSLLRIHEKFGIMLEKLSVRCPLPSGLPIICGPFSRGIICVRPTVGTVDRVALVFLPLTIRAPLTVNWAGAAAAMPKISTAAIGHILRMGTFPPGLLPAFGFREWTIGRGGRIASAPNLS